MANVNCCMKNFYLLQADGEREYEKQAKKYQITCYSFCDVQRARIKRSRRQFDLYNALKFILILRDDLIHEFLRKWSKKLLKPKIGQKII